MVGWLVAIEFSPSSEVLWLRKLRCFERAKARVLLNLQKVAKARAKAKAATKRRYWMLLGQTVSSSFLLLLLLLVLPRIGLCFFICSSPARPVLDRCRGYIDAWKLYQ